VSISAAAPKGGRRDALEKRASHSYVHNRRDGNSLDEGGAGRRSIDRSIRALRITKVASASAQRARAVIRIIDKYRCFSLRGSGLLFEQAVAVAGNDADLARCSSIRAKAPPRPIIHRSVFIGGVIEASYRANRLLARLRLRQINVSRRRDKALQLAMRDCE